MKPLYFNFIVLIFFTYSRFITPLGTVMGHSASQGGTTVSVAEAANLLWCETKLAFVSAETADCRSFSELTRQYIFDAAVREQSREPEIETKDLYRSARNSTFIQSKKE